MQKSCLLAQMSTPRLTPLPMVAVVIFATCHRAECALITLLNWYSFLIRLVELSSSSSAAAEKNQTHSQGRKLLWKKENKQSLKINAISLFLNTVFLFELILFKFKFPLFFHWLGDTWGPSRPLGCRASCPLLLATPSWQKLFPTNR